MKVELDFSSELLVIPICQRKIVRMQPFPALPLVSPRNRLQVAVLLPAPSMWTDASTGESTG